MSNYKLKYEGERIDSLLESVDKGTVVTNNTVSIVESGNGKPVSSDAVYRSLSGKVDAMDGYGLSEWSYSTEDREAVASVKDGSIITDNTLSVIDETSNKPVSSKCIAEAIDRKAEKNGRYSKLTSGFAENIVGDGSATEEVIGFRPTAGEERNVANTTYIDGERNEAARMTSIKGNSVVWDQGLIDGHYSALRTTGFNQFNGIYAKVLAGVTYHVTGDVTSIGFTAEEGGTIEDITLDNSKYTPTQNGYIYATGENICIHLCWSEYAHMEDMYEAYKPFVRDLSWIKKYFPNGMRSAGNVRDEIRYNATEEQWEAVHRVGAVDLGSLNWSIRTTDTNGVYSMGANLAAVKSAKNYEIANLTCVKYISATANDVYLCKDKTIAVLDNVIGKSVNVYDQSYTTDPLAFKNAMQGVMLNYELAEPIVTPIEEDINLDYDCSDYGTEELISEGASAPLVADVVYAPNALSTLKQVPDILRRLNEHDAKEFMPATPSGDPMHYAYEAAGAVWNASTGYWEYRKSEGGLNDLTNEDMRVCYAEAWLNSAVQSGVFFNAKGRTTLNRMVWSSAIDLTNAYRGDNLEVIFLKGSGSDAIPKNTIGLFWFCYKLKRIANVIDLNYGSVAFEIRSCPLLEYIRLKNIKKNVDIAQCPKVSKDSLLYMIQNSAATSAITIKVHADVYAKYSADSDIVAALASKTYVTLISA